MTTALAGITVDFIFSGLDALFPAVHFIPAANPHRTRQVTAFTLDYTAVRNILALFVVGALVYVNVRHPMRMEHGDHAAHAGAMDDEAEGMARATRPTHEDGGTGHLH